MTALDVRITLKLDSKKCAVMVWIGFIWLRTTSSGGLCVLSVVA
jgi:hypothetical protein